VILYPPHRRRRLTLLLGLPDEIGGCLFDLDGVLTQTADVHAFFAWKTMFDDYLRTRAEAASAPFVPFSPSCGRNMRSLDPRPAVATRGARVVRRRAGKADGGPTCREIRW